MPTLPLNTPKPINPPGAGGRIASDAYRASLSQCEDFTGLEAGVNRYELLLLVKKVGKLAGFTPRMICLLDYYLAYTRECDWEEGSRPIVYQSLARTALDLGVSERQVQKLEAALFTAGAITWNDSGNHKRYGQRDPHSGRIAYAFGVDLTPLAYLREELEGKLHTKRLYDDAWMETKRSLSRCRRQIRAMLAEWEQNGGGEELAAFDDRYSRVAVRIRTHLDLPTLRALLAQHEALLDDLTESMGVGDAPSEEPIELTPRPTTTTKSASKDAPGFAHYKYTTQQSIESCSPRDGCLQGSVAGPPRPEPPPPSLGLEHVTLGMAVQAASQRFVAHLPADPGWADLVEAASRLRRELGVSQVSWGDACGVLGRHGAAVALLVTDRASQRARDPVRQPSAYFRGMVRRAEEGQLRLHASAFGWLAEGRARRDSDAAPQTGQVPRCEGRC